MNNGDLIIRSDLDSRGFFLSDDDLDLALTGGVGSVRLLDTAGVIGTARLSTSGRALNILIDRQLHTVPLRVPHTGHHRLQPQGSVICP